MNRLRTTKQTLEEEFKQLTGLDISKEQPGEFVKLHTKQLKETFLIIEKAFEKEVECKDLQNRELLLQLEELRSLYAKLESDYESKFERNKTITMTIPSKALDIDKEEIDSIKSFRPDSDDDEEDVKRRVNELKSLKVEQQLAQKHQHVPGKKCCHNHNHNHLYMDTHTEHFGL